MKEKSQKKRKRRVRYNLKDSVFTHLFSIPRYVRELYLCLGGDGTAVREEDMKIVTLGNILAYGIHNDLGFTVNGKELYMVEAQSTVCPNITYRLNSYFCETIYAVYPRFELEQYDERKAEGMPDLYFAVVYTGKKPVPEYYEDELCGFSGQTLKIRVKILTEENTTGILRAYCIFCGKYDEFRSLYGRTAEAVERTIEYCLEYKDTEAMREYLSEHRREVEDIMSSIERQERIIEAMVEREGDIREAEGKAEGKDEERRGMLEKYKKFLENSGFSAEMTRMMYDGFVASLG